MSSSGSRFAGLGAVAGRPVGHRRVRPALGARLRSIEAAASSIKVGAILLFIAAGIIIIVLTATGSMDTEARVSNLWAHGGLFPNGALQAVIVMQGVVFANSAIEIVGISAGGPRIR